MLIDNCFKGNILEIFRIAGLNPSDSNPYSSIKDSNINVIGLNQDCNSLVNGNPWRNPYSNPYVYDAATAVALVGYSPYAAGYSPHMDLAGRRKNATRETTATLKAWLYEHRKNPYPTKSEKVYLAIMTKMTLTQVSTWFANARRRLKKENKMTWSPRNRTTDDDDDRNVDQSNSDGSDDESTSPTIQTTNPSSLSTTITGIRGTTPIPTSTTTTSQTSFISNIHYLSPPLTLIQHHHIEQQNIPTDETNRKRKYDENDIRERKKRCGIWSLADMAEKNNKNNKNDTFLEKQQQTRSYSISSSSTSSSPTSSSQGQTIVGAFKPFK
ncbi:unnamed protein product [Rotaria sordida]|uniref:Homeobox domain-containing protein n=1 Tax=Rotaria sordida TaxID=392033 RepID=A0A814WCZ7_9BILA|nr:unnamed protein product [Rotaria sordida]CAF1123798.1 unnamed protein product [Rotaria sordida]CAF1136668.1 unnamed protein product [Rotaria sordida]CAF1200569.1 unnamed protein product [Rotaria sordida]CAF3936815.1 unnamed protein product [Rotaria sordida]